MVLPIVYKEFG